MKKFSSTFLGFFLLFVYAFANAQIEIVNTPKNLSCFLSNNGEISVSASNGSEPYQFKLNSGTFQSNNVFTNLSAGNYSITVSDALGSTATTTLTLTQPNNIGIPFGITPINCNGLLGQISISNQIVGGTPPFSLTFNGQPTPFGSISILTAGEYSFAVKDANNCESSKIILFGKDPSYHTLISPPSTINQNQSATLEVSGLEAYRMVSTSGTAITLQGGFYEKNGGIISMTPSDNNNFSQKFIFISTEYFNEYYIRDRSLKLFLNNNFRMGINDESNNYRWRILPISGGIYQIKNVANNLVITVQGNVVGLAPINGSSQQFFTLAKTDGVSYNWSSGQTTNPITVSPTTNTNYSVTVAGAVCPTTLTTTVNYNPNPVPIINITKTDLRCFNQNDGSASASVSGGTAPYKYQWSNGYVLSTVTNMSAGTYVLTVTDALNSTATAQVIINQPTALISTPLVSYAKCFGTNTGSISIFAAGGVSPYLYSLNGGIATASGSFVNLQAGVYSSRVTDFNGCVSNIPTIIVGQPMLLSFISTKTNVSSTGGNDGSISIVSSGGTTPYVYSKDGITFQSSNVFAGLLAGNYSITVKDFNGCTSTLQVSISQPSNLQLSTTVISPNCQQSNGAINLVVSGGTSPFTYQWSNGSTTEDLSNLAQGTYTVTVTDAANATATTSVSLSWSDCRFDLALKMVPALPSQQIKAGDEVPFTITVYNQGTIAATNIQITDYIPAGMTLNDPSWTQIGSLAVLNIPIQVLGPGVLTQIVIRLKVNTTFLGTRIVNRAEISSFTTAFNLPDIDSKPDNTPFNDAGGKELSPSDDSIIGNGTGVPSGTDATTDEDDSDPAAINIFIQNLVVSVSGTNTLCNDDSNGSAIANVAGGVSPYTYLWSTGSSSSSISGLVAGTYSLTVTDNFGGTATSTVNITQPSAGSITTTPTNLTCNSLGSISVVALGGSGIYSYSVNSQDYQSNNTFLGLDAGSYTIIVKDDKACFIGVETVEIMAYVPLDMSISSTDVKCGVSGSITVNASGGSGGYSYQLNDDGFQANNIFTSLTSGNYSITVKDLNACETTATVKISVTNNLIVTAQIGNCAGELLVNANELSNVVFKINNGVYDYQRQFFNLPTGNYTVYAKDTSSGCIDSVKIFMPESLKITLNTQNILCKGANDGKITVSASGGKSTNYQYQLNNGTFQTSNIFTNLLAGNYTITVAEGSSCFETATTTLTSPTTTLSITATTKNVSCGGGNNGSVTLTITGGVPTYSKQLLKNNQIVQTLSGSQGLVFQNVMAGVYVVKVIDANNCEANINVTITQPIALVLNTSSNNATCFEKNNGVISAEIKNGIAPYIFKITGPKNQTFITYYTKPSFGNLPSGTYQLSVSDKRGCLITKTIIITQPAKLNLTLAATPASSKNTFNGKITSSSTGGTLPYLYQLNSGIFQSNNVFSNLKTGLYYVTVKDKEGCKTQASISVPVATSNFVSDFSQSSISNLVLSPNPIESNNLTIKIDAEDDDEVVVELVDSKGKTTMRKNMKISSLDSEILLDISSLDRVDTYIVRVYSEKKIYGQGRLMRLK